MHPLAPKSKHFAFLAVIRILAVAEFVRLFPKQPVCKSSLNIRLYLNAEKLKKGGV